MPDDPKPRIEDDDDISKERNGRWQHLVNYCIDTYTEIEKSEYRQKKIAEIEESRNAYEQVEEKVTEPWDGASNVILPLTTISNDNLEPRMVAGFIGKQPYLNIEMENEQEKDEQTELLQTWFNQELQDAVKIENVTNDMVHLLQLEGTIYPIPSYNLDEEVRREFLFDNAGNVELDQMGIPATQDSMHKKFEGGKVDLAPFKDVFIPDNVDDPEKAPFIRKVYPTYAELQRDSVSKEGYLNIGTWLCKEEVEEKLDDDSQSSAQSLEGARVTAKEVIECIECSVRYIYQTEEEEKEDVKDFTEERLVAQIALDKKILIRLVLLRQLNFQNEHLVKRVRLFPEKGLSYGTSVYGKIKSIQKGASKTFNMALNIAEIVLIPWFFFTSKLGIKGEKELKPGAGVEVESLGADAIYFPRFNINPDQMFNYMSIWQGFWEKLISIGNVQAGLPAERKETATTTLAMLEEGNIKHNYQAKRTREEYLAVLRTLWDLYYQHMPLDKTFLFNKQQTPIPRVGMRRAYQFRLTGSTEMSNKLIERKQAEDLYTLTTQDESGIFNPIKPREDLLKTYGKTNISEWINPQIAKVVKTIQEMPGAMQLFEQAVQETQELAQAMDEEGKARAAAATKVTREALVD